LFKDFLFCQKGVDEMQSEKGEVKVFWDTVNGKKVLRLSAKHIPEELKNELVALLGAKAKYLEVKAEK
jgi:riboflavin synthase